MAVCRNNCRYNFITNSSELVSQSISGSTLTLSVSPPQLSTIDNVTVVFDTKPCTSLSGTLSNFTCELETNSDGTPIIRAGSHNAVVNIEGYGVVPLSDSLSPIVQNLFLASVSPSSSGENGGFEVKLTGEGFPETKNEANIEICGVYSTIISINNIQTVFILPPCTQGPSTITYTYRN